MRLPQGLWVSVCALATVVRGFATVGRVQLQLPRTHAAEGVRLPLTRRTAADGGAASPAGRDEDTAVFYGAVGCLAVAVGRSWLGSPALPAATVAEQLALSRRLLAGAAAGGAVGLEKRTRRGGAETPIGMRTMSLISLGTALFACSGPRCAAAAVMGCGFLGAGAIRLEGGDRLRGVSTATAVWLAAALGVVAGRGLFLAAGLGTAFAVGCSRIRPLALFREARALLDPLGTTPPTPP